MKKYTVYETSTILTVAGKVLDAINRLPELLEAANIALPAEYSDTQKGGYLSLYQRNPFIKSGEVLLLAKIGEIADAEDATFGSKSEKYQKYAGKKCRALIQASNTWTSDQTILNIKGGIAVNDSLVMACSGRTAFEDELLVTVTTLVCASFFSSANAFNTDGKMIHLENIEGNPFLSQAIVSTIAQYCTK
jgi:hypothetical protein